MLKSTWRSTGLNIRAKIMIFKATVLSVLLYGSECLKTSRSLQMGCLGNRRPYKNTLALSLPCPPHVPNSLPRVAFRWTPQVKRTRCRQKETWRRTVIKDLKIMETAPPVATGQSQMEVPLSRFKLQPALRGLHERVCEHLIVTLSFL